MKSFLIIFLLLFADPGGIHRIARTNKAKKEAEEAFRGGSYRKALEKYQYLSDSLKVREDPVDLNKAHCYYRLNEKIKSEEVYTKLTSSVEKSIRSIANQQLGILAFQRKELDKSLGYFKNALKAYPDNREARYNYELVKKLLNEKEKKKDDKKDKKDKNEDKPFEPSEYAKKLKAQAELLAGRYDFEGAYNLMAGGIKKDKTVLYYKDFIEKLRVVTDLNKL